MNDDHDYCEDCGAPVWGGGDLCTECAAELYKVTAHYPSCGVGERTQQGICDCRDRAARAREKVMGRDCIVEMDEGCLAESYACPRCRGKGYHHGFGDAGNDPDWCGDCGGPGDAWRDLLTPPET